MASSKQQSTIVLVPLRMDAFILNPSCCDEKNDYLIAPISQPNYTFLRLDNNLLEADILDHVDLHTVTPAVYNPRLTDLGTGELRRNRLGVYLHWVLPQVYRTGAALAKDGAQSEEDQRAEMEDFKKERIEAGFPNRSAPRPSEKEDYSNPEFRPVPNRWLVVRRLHPGSTKPSSTQLPLFEAWIIQSDALRKLSADDSLKGLDLETDCSPFTQMDRYNEMPEGNDAIDVQGEVFIGKKVPISRFNEDTAAREPKVDLNVMTSANPLLPDYQPHNSNIFSTVDNFEYEVNGKKEYLTEATADYHVLGWHSEDDDDPFTTSNPDAVIPRNSTRLEQCNFGIKVDDHSPDWLITWLESRSASSSRVLCHASMYNVRWKAQDLSGIDVEANRVGKHVRETQPFAIGTTNLDALDAFLSSGSEDDQELKKTLKHVLDLVGETDDGDVDGLQEASDEAYKLSFEKHDGGIKWYWKFANRPDEPPQAPEKEEIDSLDDLNLTQSGIDNLLREVGGLRWQLFATWWIWVSSFLVQKKFDEYREQTKAILDRLKGLNNSGGGIARLQSLMDKKESLVNKIQVLQKKHHKDVTNQEDSLKRGVRNRYYQRSDPTLLLTKSGYGWDPDFSQTLPVRIDKQAISSNPTDDELEKKNWKGYKSKVTEYAAKLPEEIRHGAAKVLGEFYELHTERAVRNIGPNQAIPRFHENYQASESAQPVRRDRWNNRQPWRPMFIEWEVLYWQIPFENWELREYHTENKWGASEVYYAVKESFDVKKHFSCREGHTRSEDHNNTCQNYDTLRVAGRNYLQPQGPSTLRTLVDERLRVSKASLLKKAFEDPDMTDEQLDGLKQALLDTVSAFEIVSAPLSSITNTLLTVREGSHLKPLARMPNSAPEVLQAAADAFATIVPTGHGNAREILSIIDDQGETTPLGSTVEVNREHYPMKPVTHGHAQFIKLNIVDKFGQAIPLVSPRPPRPDEVHTAYPIISQSLSVGQRNGKPNTVHFEGKICPFFSLPPSINQTARLNALYVRKVIDEQTKRPIWRRTTDWESPIWGWIVVNYADSGLQFFFADGQFYREVRFSDFVGAAAGFKYLPFDPPSDQKTVNDADKSQLAYLIDELRRDPGYLTSLWDTITRAQELASFQHTPDFYADFTSAITGRPLALVNAGWSLELAEPPRRNWTVSDVTMGALDPPRHLLKPVPESGDHEPWKYLEPGAWEQWDVESARTKGYAFPVKLGDDARAYDGLVGFFQSRPRQDLHPPVEPGHDSNVDASDNDLDLKHFYTFPAFCPPGGAVEGDRRREIAPDNYPVHTPYWFSAGLGSSAAPLPRHDDKLQVLGMLVDPFSPVHAFSGILPIKPLRLPQWTVESALKRMTAFWRTGPIVVEEDVRPAPPGKGFVVEDSFKFVLELARLRAEKEKKEGEGEEDEEDDGLPTVELPVPPPSAAKDGGSAEILYLQPYWTTPKAGEEGEPRTRFAPYGIDGPSAQGLNAASAKLGKGPYTALEGFLQVVKGLR